MSELRFAVLIDGDNIPAKFLFFALSNLSPEQRHTR